MIRDVPLNKYLLSGTSVLSSAWS